MERIGLPGQLQDVDMNWWVVPEGFLGQLQTAFTVGPVLHIYTPKQSTLKPPGAVAGPFATQAEAQAKADELNKSGVATPGNIAKQAASSALTSLNPLAPVFQANIWMRVGEFIIGIVLIGVGLAKLTGAENFISTAVKKVPL